VAYKAEIAVNVRGLKDVKTLETSLNKISGKISAINKISIGNSKAAKIEEKVAKSKEAQRVSMIQTRRVGDAVQRGADKGLQTEKALAAVKRAAKADAQGQLKVSEAQRKIALEELKVNQGLTQEKVKQVNLQRQMASPIGGIKTMMGSPAQQAFSGGPSIPIRGSKDIFGSPAYYDAANKEAFRIAKANAMPIKGFKNLPGSPAFHEEQAKRLKRLRGASTGFSAAEFGPQQPMQGPAMGPTSMGLNFDKRTGKLLRGPAGSGGGGFRNLGRRFDRGSALISGGFPLLFGQGPVTAAAGALGGGIGGMFGQMGGFAGGIAATAAVTSIQNAINGIGELGKAMNRLNPNISAMSQAIGISGTMEEKRIQLIEQNQGKQAAFNAALEMMGDKIGADRAEELRKFGETFQKLGNDVTLFFTKVQAAVAKLLNQALGDGENRSVQRRTTKLLQQNPNNPAFRNINKQIADLEAQRGPGGGGRGKNKELENRINALKREKREIAEGIIIEKDKDALRANTNKLITAGLAGLEKENQLNRAIIAGKEEEFLIEEAIKSKVDELGLTMETINAGQLQRIRDGVTINKDLKEQAENAKMVKDAFESLSVTIKDDIKNGIAGLIKGTATLGDMLNNIADKLINVGLDHILFGSVLGAAGGGGGGLFGLLGFANGGRPPVGKPSIVGEKGPELFVPKRSGTIIPNDKLAGGGSTNISVNVDASGSSVQSNEQQGKELGRVISAAIQSELIKQRRPGGLLR